MLDERDRMQRVIEAAKAMRPDIDAYDHGITLSSKCPVCNRARAFDAALAKLEGMK